MFNEDSLRADIVDKWGPAGAHVDVFDHLLGMVTALKEQRDTLLGVVTELRAEIARLEACARWCDRTATTTTKESP